MRHSQRFVTALRACKTKQERREDLDLLTSLVEVGSFIKGLKTTATWAFYGLAATFAFTVIYELITPCREWHMMLVEKNKAALASFQGAIFGFAFPVLAAVALNHTFPKFFQAVTVSAVVQLVLYLIIWWGVGGLRKRMHEKDEVAGRILASIWLLGGLFTAAASIGQ